MDRADILVASLQTATIYSILNVLIWIFYPTVTSILWQGYLGRFIASRWPQYVQAQDINRYSFMIAEGRAVVLRIGLVPAPFMELTKWLRDGFLYGVLFCLIGESVMTSLLVSMIMVWIFLKMIVLSFSPRNFIFVDRMFDSARSVLMMGALVYGLSYAGLFMAAN